MRPKPTDIGILSCALATFAPAVEAQNASSEGAPWLLLPVGAQAVSLGRAMTWVEGSEGAFWNPAGLAGLDRSQVVVFRSDHVAGTATAVSVLWSHSTAGTLGASYFLLDAGEIEQRDDFGNSTGSITIRDHLGIVSAATRLLDNLSLGLNFKVIRFQLSCRGICTDEGTTGTTYAVDAGVLGTPIDRLRVGAMIAHAGPRLQVLNAEQADPLPSRLRFAVAYDALDAILATEELHGWLAVEYEDRLRELGIGSLYIGSEITAGQVDALALRAGYVWSELDQEDGGRVGLGLTYERFNVSIAKSLAVSTLTGETEPIHVTFSIAF